MAQNGFLTNGKEIEMTKKEKLQEELINHYEAKPIMVGLSPTKAHLEWMDRKYDLIEQLAELKEEEPKQSIPTEEEIHKIIVEGLYEAFEMGLKQSPMDADNSEYCKPYLDLDKAKKMTVELINKWKGE